MDEIADEGINRNHAFRFELAQRYVDRPLVRAYRVQAVIGEVDTLADSHTCVPEQQEGISGKIVAAHQLLLQEMILLCGERTWQALRCTRNIFAAYQVSKFSKLVCPGQLIQDGAQSDEASDAGCRSQRRSLCAHARHPSKGVRIAAQLLEAGNPGAFGAEIDKEAAYRDVVVAFGGRTERGGEGLNGARKGRRQWMLEWRPAPSLHEVILGWGWMHCAAARAY
jgi:hypothetical protein